jgi:hypothetical protein
MTVQSPRSKHVCASHRRAANPRCLLPLMASILSSFIQVDQEICSPSAVGRNKSTFHHCTCMTLWTILGIFVSYLTPEYFTKKSKPGHLK